MHTISNSGEVAISILYVSPSANCEELESALELVRMNTSASAITMGDINARNRKLCTVSNLKSSLLLRWAEKNRWTINVYRSRSFRAAKIQAMSIFWVSRKSFYWLLPIADGNRAGISDYRTVFSGITAITRSGNWCIKIYSMVEKKQRENTEPCQRASSRKRFCSYYSPDFSSKRENFDECVQ